MHNEYIISATDSGYKLIFLASSNKNVSFLVYDVVKEDIKRYIETTYGSKKTIN